MRLTLNARPVNDRFEITILAVSQNYWKLSLFNFYTYYIYQVFIDRNFCLKIFVYEPRVRRTDIQYEPYTD